MPVSDYTPGIEQVAGLIRARTKERGSGLEAGTFTENTRPTADQVTQMITEAANEVSATLGPDIPDAPGDDPNALRSAASGIVALLAAMNAEGSFYPEQIETGRSNYPALERRYNRALDRIAAAVEAAGGSTAGDEGAGGYMRASFDFGDHEMTTMDEPL